MDKLDDFYRRLGEEISRLVAHCCKERQLLNLMNDDIREVKDVKDLELKGIVIATWEKQNGIWVVLLEYR